VAKIRDVMFAVFRESNLPPISTNTKDTDVKTWKGDTSVKNCYEKLFKKIKPTESETYMSKIIDNLWKGGKKKGPKIQIAFAISICESILNPNNSIITINEEVIKPILTKNLVRF